MKCIIQYGIRNSVLLMLLLSSICEVTLADVSGGSQNGASTGIGEPVELVQSISLSPDDAFINYGQTQLFTVTAHRIDGSIYTVSSSLVVFSLDSNSIADIDASGTVNSAGIGNVMLTAEYAGKTAQAKIHAIGKTPVFQTGQTLCYNENAIILTNCDGTGQDGEYKSGLSLKKRFTVNGDCVTDNVTGLMWAKPAVTNLQALVWHDLVSMVHLKSTCGYGDWHIPNLNELRSLVNYGKDDNAIYLQTQGFDGASLQSLVWTSTLDLRMSNQAFFYIDMRTGSIATDQGLVWPPGFSTTWMVRNAHPFSSTVPVTGQTWCSNFNGDLISCSDSVADGQDGQVKAGVAFVYYRFLVAGVNDECITDLQSGLTWMRTPEPSTYTWQDALNYAGAVNSNNLCGMDNWRLPSINELASLMNQRFPHDDSATATYPEDTSDYLYDYLNRLGFSGLLPETYWSSTTYSGAPREAWSFDMSNGGLLYKDSKANRYRILLVRGRKDFN